MIASTMDLPPDQSSLNRQGAPVRKEGAMGINSKTFAMQIIDSDPDGIKICHIQGSTMVTVVVPRRLLPRLKELPDIPTRGVYYLLQLERGSLRRVYAGKTTNGIDRLNSHNSQKDWWNTAVMFLMPENALSSDVVDGLEATAISYISVHDGYTTDNSAAPKPYVNPYNENYIEELHREVLFRMKVLGYDLDQMDGGERALGDDAPAAEPVAPSGASKAPQPASAACTASEPDDGISCHTKTNGVKGLGRFHPRDGSFEVLAGSQIDMARDIISKDQQKYRQGLFKHGSIVEVEDDLYVLKTPQVFDNVSRAANFVLGNSRNGWHDWYDGQGQHLSVHKGGMDVGHVDDAGAAPAASAASPTFEKPASNVEGGLSSRRRSAA